MPENEKFIRDLLTILNGLNKGGDDCNLDEMDADDRKDALSVADQMFAKGWGMK